MYSRQMKRQGACGGSRRLSARPLSRQCGLGMDTVYIAHVHGWQSNASGETWPHCTDVFSSQGLVSLFSVLASSLSLVALVFAFITFSLFSEIRGTSGTAITNLLAALFMAQLLYVVAVAGPPHLSQKSDDGLLCIALVGAQHYMRISALSWLLVIALDMRKTFHENITLVTSPLASHELTSNFIKSSLLGWGVPLLSAVGAALLEQTRGELDCCVVEAARTALVVLASSTGLLCGATLVCLASAFVYARAAGYAQVDISIRNRVLRTRGAQVRQVALLTVLVALTSVLAVCSSTNAHWLAPWFHAAAGLQGVSVSVALLGPACCCCCPTRWWLLAAPSRSHFSRQGNHRSTRPGSLLASPSPSLQLLVSPSPNVV